VQPRAAGPLVELHQLLALLEAPQRRRERADVHGLVVTFSRWFRMRPISLNRVRISWPRSGTVMPSSFSMARQGMFLVHRRDVIEAVEIRHRLQM
jgi:hypothetical protein